MIRPPSLLLALAAGLLSTVGTVAQAAGVLSDQPLQLAGSIPLDVLPSHVLFRPKTNEFVVALNDGKEQTATVLGFTVPGLSQAYRYEIPHSAEVLVFSAEGDWLFAVGGKGAAGFASAIRLSRPSETSVATVKLGSRPTLPSLAVDIAQNLYLGDATSSRIIVLPSATFQEAAAGKVVNASKQERQVFYANGGVRSVAVFDSLKLAFVSANNIPLLSAVELGGTNRIVDEYGVYKKGDSSPPLAMVMTSLNSPASGYGNNATASFLLADHDAKVLSVIDYDPLFETLDLVTTASVAIRLDPRSAVEFEPGTRLIKQPMLIASDDNQETILLGNLYSSQLIQFSRSPFAAALERIGSIELGGTPSSIAVKAEGDAAVVSLSERSDLQFLASAEGVPEGDQLGDPKVRELQRVLTELGFNIGAIDGIRGPATDSALVAFRQVSGIDFSLSDPDAALNAVTEFSRNCGKSGLVCFTGRQSAE